MIRARHGLRDAAFLAGLVTVFLISAVGVQAAEGAAEEAAAAPSPVSSGFVETVWIVRDLDVWIEVFERVGGYELAYRGTVDGRLADYWGVDLGAEGEGITEALMRNPGTESGYVRLLQLSGEATPIHRPFAQSWDSGGHFDVNLRTRDIDARIDELEALGWSAQSAPVEFSFGPFRVREVLPAVPTASSWP